jgi:hypothetical protein
MQISKWFFLFLLFSTSYSFTVCFLSCPSSFFLQSPSLIVCSLLFSLPFSLLFSLLFSLPFSLLCSLLFSLLFSLSVSHSMLPLALSLALFYSFFQSLLCFKIFFLLLTIPTALFSIFTEQFIYFLFDALR